jgi:hypothetical protein
MGPSKAGMLSTAAFRLALSDRRIDFASTMNNALVEQDFMQAGPSLDDSHKSHLTATMPVTFTKAPFVCETPSGAALLAPISENPMTPNGQAIAHSLQPMQEASFSATDFSVIVMALTGQMAAHGAFSQCRQVIGVEISPLRTMYILDCGCRPAA